MSDLSNNNSSVLPSCDCYKKLQAYGIPLYISDENDYYTEDRKISFENAFPLPGRIEIDEKITEYLAVEDNDLYNVFYHMAVVIPKLKDFDVNLLNFWLLDMFIEGLWTAQNANMNFKHQKATLLWIAYCFNYILKENPTRNCFFNHLKEVIFQVDCCKKDTDSDTSDKNEESIHSQSQNLEHHEIEKRIIWEIPFPPDYSNKQETDATYLTQTLYSEEEEEEEISTTIDLESSTEMNPSNNEVIDEINETIKNSEHMKIIFEIIYRIFGRLWVYLEIQTVFHNMPPTNKVDLPFKLTTPKPLLKTESSSEFKIERGGRRQTTSERSGEAEFDKELFRNDFIFPLQAAEESPSILRQYYGNGSQLSMNKQKKNMN